MYWEDSPSADSTLTTLQRGKWHRSHKQPDHAQYLTREECNKLRTACPRPIAEQLDYYHQFGGVTLNAQVTRTAIGVGIESFGECDEDPIWKYLLTLNAAETKQAKDYMRGKYDSIEPGRLLLGTIAVQLSKPARDFWRQSDNHRTDRKASVIAKLLKYALRHDGELVRNSGGWASVGEICEQLRRDGYVTNTLNLLMHAICLLPKGLIEMQGINACEATNVYQKTLRNLRASPNKRG